MPSSPRVKALSGYSTYERVLAKGFGLVPPVPELPVLGGLPDQPHPSFQNFPTFPFPSRLRIRCPSNKNGFPNSFTVR